MSISFFRLTDQCVGRSFSMCSHDLIFGTNKYRILKNGSCERAFIKMRVSGEKVLFLLVVSYTSIQGLQNLVFPYSL